MKRWFDEIAARPATARAYAAADSLKNLPPPDPVEFARILFGIEPPKPAKKV